MCRPCVMLRQRYRQAARKSRPRAAMVDRSLLQRATAVLLLAVLATAPAGAVPKLYPSITQVDFFPCVRLFNRTGSIGCSCECSTLHAGPSHAALIALTLRMCSWAGRGHGRAVSRGDRGGSAGAGGRSGCGAARVGCEPGRAQRHHGIAAGEGGPRGLHLGCAHRRAWRAVVRRARSLAHWRVRGAQEATPLSPSTKTLGTSHEWNPAVRGARGAAACCPGPDPPLGAGRALGGRRSAIASPSWRCPAATPPRCSPPQHTIASMACVRGDCMRPV